MVETTLVLGYYLFILFGSVSLGYLVLRLTFPEIRTFTGNRKLAASFLLGIVMALTAIALDYMVYREAVLSLASSTAFFLLVALLFYFLAFRVYAAMRASKRQFVTVGLPVKEKKTPAGEDLEKRIASVKQRVAKAEKIAPPGGMQPTAEVPKFLQREKQRELHRLKEEEQKLQAEAQRREKAKQARRQKQAEHIEVIVPVKKETEFVTWRKREPAQVEKQAAKQLPLTGKAKAEEKENIEAEIETLMGADKKKAVKGKTAPESGKPMHRQYLTHGEVKVIAPKHVAESNEFNELVQDVYSQLEKTKLEKKSTDILKPDAPKPPEEKKQVASVVESKPEVGVSISDILGGTDLFAKPVEEGKEKEKEREAEITEAAPAGKDIFGKLSEISGEKESKEEKPKPKAKSVELVKMQAEKGIGCPTCHSANSRIIFCPYCGTGMCANCSPSVKPLGEGNFVYTCPKCGEEVDVKKR